MRRKVTTAVVGAMLALACAAPAFADQSPGQQGYEGQPGNQGNGTLGYEGQPGNQGGH
jgi:Spy/CpxP family protein refolding chaperone